jgi:hypothetical protein
MTHSDLDVAPRPHDLPPPALEHFAMRVLPLVTDDPRGDYADSWSAPLRDVGSGLTMAHLVRDCAEDLLYAE